MLKNSVLQNATLHLFVKREKSVERLVTDSGKARQGKEKEERERGKGRVGKGRGKKRGRKEKRKEKKEK